MDDNAYERVANDAGLRAVIKTARAWGVSPRRFLGWEAARTTSYTYKDGRLIRSVENYEAEWDEESRDLAIAYAMYEADLCPGCRQPMSETTQAEREGLYIATGAIRCHFCTASHQASEVYSDSPQAEALYIPVEYRGK